MNERKEVQLREEIHKLFDFYGINGEDLNVNDVNGQLQHLVFFDDIEIYNMAEMIYSIILREINESNRRKN